MMKKVIIVLGPTGIGKTGFSILLAKALNTEIISADSMQVYRHMDIGTAKASPDELAGVRHHLIDILSPSETFSAGLFRDRAVEIIGELHSKGKVPLIAGGTGLYIRSLTDGLFEGPSADWGLREELMEEEKREGEGHLYRRLQDIDPPAAEKIDPNDLRRTIRALEVSLKEDKSISVCRKDSTTPPDYEFIKIGLNRERDELYRMIEKRVDQMIERGLLKETEQLLKMKPAYTALQALGCKEMGQYLKGEVDFEEAVRLTKKRSKMYAKRQFTWFNKETDIHWVDITGLMDSFSVYEKVINDVTILKTLRHT